MNNNSIYMRATQVTVAFTFFTLFVSKAGMNIAFALILLTALAGMMTKQTVLSDQPFHRNITIACISLYVLGLITTFIEPLSTQDFSWFARKGAFLLLVPFFIPMVQQHQRTALNALLLGVIVALAYCVYVYVVQNSFPQGRLRLHSFWDVGRWSEILAYFIALCIGLTYYRGVVAQKRRVLLIILATLCFVALLASGSRGPLLFVAMTVFMFLALENKKLFLLSLLALGALLFLSRESSTFSGIYDNVASIFANNNESNNARFLMWNNGIGFTLDNIENHLSVFLFGTGDHQIETLYSQYLQSIGSIEEMQQRVNNQMSLNDFHNQYIDNLVRMGIIYTLCYLGFLVTLLIGFTKQLITGSKVAWAGILLILTYAGIGLVYSNNLEFQTAIFFFMLTLILAWPPKPQTLRSNH
ncbi:O-Antigen ligase [Vibrio thalassae]|uniref:O-Antigen ligase n=1 Tax=Vibrio thalassae TaxID=1243014 RepID=A0A240EGM0_9VIBR|nr:O-antigen ligase family protein [Vibrio thalassae]SNX47837.1 O-Antigen ligase [Vibrio thalassae]